eukprot:s1005_g27.t1
MKKGRVLTEEELAEFKEDYYQSKGKGKKRKKEEAAQPYRNKVKGKGKKTHQDRTDLRVTSEFNQDHTDLRVDETIEGRRMGQMEGGEEELPLEVDELETIEEVFASSQEEAEFMRWLTEPDDETVATTTTNPVEDTVEEEDVKRVALRLHAFHCTAYPDYLRDRLFIGDGQRFLDLLGLEDVEGKRTLTLRGVFQIEMSPRCLEDESQWVLVEDVEWELVEVLGLPPADAAPDIPAAALADAAPEVPAAVPDDAPEAEVPAASSPAAAPPKPNRNKMEPAAPEDAPEAEVPAASSSSPPASPPKPNRNKMVLEPAAPTMVAPDDDTLEV